jgi:hypothetical protein
MVTIQFIGLLILTNLTSSGALVLGGNLPKHQLFIAYLQGTLVSQTNWPKAGSFSYGGNTYDYVDAANENVAFSGTSDPFAVDPDHFILPHLSCCCSSMTGIKSEYLPLPTAGIAVAVNNGVLSTSPIPAQMKVPEQMLLTFNLTSGQNLTITGTMTSTTQTLVLSPGTSVLSVLIGNAPPEMLNGQPLPSDHDFLEYYQMGINAGTCMTVPSDGPPCFPQANACTTPPSSPRKFTLTAKQKKLVAAARARVKIPAHVTDVNCSNSQWP